ncbi:hypothetical protein L226DRAFT_566264 [Lentinus tigrinus ALCF2SS1-7]|uniref:uncharacterized protein n=1 Tax=Lentinus tigrinus ALCF2SS1-7 TaxID=1328758 RepID=UPI001165ECDB|nr:hypothetical protein L226DRAFT_566264 [Lentinus tigrinus ALCF2SS1-7]
MATAPIPLDRIYISPDAAAIFAEMKAPGNRDMAERDALQALSEAGITVVRTTGAHKVFKATKWRSQKVLGGKAVTVSIHEGTLRAGHRKCLAHDLETQFVLSSRLVVGSREQIDAMEAQDAEAEKAEAEAERARQAAENKAARREAWTSKATAKATKNRKSSKPAKAAKPAKKK